MKTFNEARWWREHFPTASAREAADATIDKLPLSEPMAVYIDTWVEAYLRAGGKTPLGSLPPATPASA